MGPRAAPGGASRSPRTRRVPPRAPSRARLPPSTASDGPWCSWGCRPKSWMSVAQPVAQLPRGLAHLRRRPQQGRHRRGLRRRRAARASGGSRASRAASAVRREHDGERQHRGGVRGRLGAVRPDGRHHLDAVGAQHLVRVPARQPAPGRTVLHRLGDHQTGQAVHRRPREAGRLRRRRPQPEPVRHDVRQRGHGILGTVGEGHRPRRSAGAERASRDERGAARGRRGPLQQVLDRRGSEVEPRLQQHHHGVDPRVLGQRPEGEPELVRARRAGGVDHTGDRGRGRQQQPQPRLRVLRQVRGQQAGQAAPAPRALARVVVVAEDRDAPSPRWWLVRPGGRPCPPAPAATPTRVTPVRRHHASSPSPRAPRPSPPSPVPVEAGSGEQEHRQATQPAPRGSAPRGLRRRPGRPPPPRSAGRPPQTPARRTARRRHRARCPRGWRRRPLASAAPRAPLAVTGAESLTTPTEPARACRRDRARSRPVAGSVLTRARLPGPSTRMPASRQRRRSPATSATAPAAPAVVAPPVLAPAVLAPVVLAPAVMAPAVAPLGGVPSTARAPAPASTQLRAAASSSPGATATTARSAGSAAAPGALRPGRPAGPARTG